MSDTIAAPKRQANGPTAPLFAMEDVVKTFGHVEALRGMSMAVSRGEVVALVGDNGAGKSTLIKAMSGVQPADFGRFYFDGRQVAVKSPADSATLGLAFVFQDLALCDNLDVASNLFLGHERTRFSLIRAIDQLSMEQAARELLDIVGIRTLSSLRVPVGELSGGQRQAIAIARAMLGDPNVVVLDEPTAALGVSQTEQVLQLIVRLRETGRGVILVSHNLADVFAVADRIVVLRLGAKAGEYPAEQRFHRDVVSAITGIADELPLADQRIAKGGGR